MVLLAEDVRMQSAEFQRVERVFTDSAVFFCWAVG
jgi:hypothetical protein